MSILIMTIGCLVILLVCNTLIIISNPENLEITSVVRAAYEDEDGSGGFAGVPLFANKAKEPHYIDVYREYVVLYPDKVVVRSADLERKGNPFEEFVNDVAKEKETDYVVLLLRPRSSRTGRKLRSVIRDRGVDVGQELYELGRKIRYGKSVVEE